MSQTPNRGTPQATSTGNTLPTYGDVAQGTVLEPIVLPDGRTAYVPVSESALRAPYGNDEETPAVDTAPEYLVDVSGGANDSDTTRPARDCRPSLYAAILPLNGLAFIFSILSIAAPFVKGYTVCEYLYYWGSFCVWRDGYAFAFSSQSGFALGGAVNMAIGFVFFIPTLVLSAVLFHRRDQEVAAREITVGVCTMSALSVGVAAITTAVYFEALYTEFDDTRIVIGPVMALLATVLYLAASILLCVAC
ncbi:hypothetical protein ADEAN_000128500 [Angomonas deanei]|uniref:Uncharacterized protein n=1 Tax=Angomonas deanei TaxID=59799 RepID=A0A7G2C799_9TRYP|nr:hypothetical protein ADEAN_000128500 [Angomonas deanei]